FDEDRTNLDEENKYPIYGDESRVDYQALSREELYLKVEKDKNSLLYGDFNTDLNKTRLTSYNRAFTGFAAEADEGPFMLRSFAAHTQQTQVVDVLPGRGISGYYFLSRNLVIPGSERVIIETRDRHANQVVLDRKTLTRGVDYEMEYAPGLILFKEPVPSRDERFNPVFIVATYEAETHGDDNSVYGGRAAVQPLSWLTIGGTWVTEETDFKDKYLAGSDLTLNLPSETRIKAEAAWANSLFDTAGGLTEDAGNAWRVELQSRPVPDLALEAHYQDVGTDFSNPSAVDALRGTLSIGASASWRPLTSWEFHVSHFHEEDNLTDSQDRRSMAGVTKTLPKLTLYGDVLMENYTQGSPPLADDDRLLLAYADEELDDATSVRGGLEYEITPRLKAVASHKQGVDGSDHILTNAGLDYAFSDVARAYVREEYGKYEEREELRTVGGVEAQLMKNTVAFSEYRLDNGASGDRNQQVIGLRNKFMLGRSVTGNFSVEHLSTLSGDDRPFEPDALAVAGALEYLPREDFLWTLRLEYRDEDSAVPHAVHLGELGLAYKAHPDHTLLARTRNWWDDFDNGTERLTSRTFVGWAWRPVEINRYNLLAKLEYKTERDTASAPSFTSDAFIPSIQGVLRIVPDLVAKAKYAAKFTDSDGFDNYTDLVSGRLTYTVKNRVDFTGCARVLTAHEAGAVFFGGYGEVGLRVAKDLWFALGYSMDEFDADLVGGDYTGKGGYLRLRFKFDEGLLGM
ncbi:MAG: hypothetical protein JRI97_11045, partial [Deltaproteobacteria bacterium]|nr:hypothetical protein [Deltaproteobacteria bacterium]